MITVGSVRGKERLETPFLVAQAARSRGFASTEVAPPCAVGREAKSVGGHTRFVPALTDNVGWPQPAQKGFRAFQSMRARACAYMAADAIIRRGHGQGKKSIPSGAFKVICIRPSTN